MITAFRKTAETFQAGAKTLPRRYFVSPDVFAQEQEKIFSKQWVLVGHQSRIAQAGDYFTAEIAGESLIIVRDKRGEIHTHGHTDWMDDYSARRTWMMSWALIRPIIRCIR